MIKTSPLKKSPKSIYGAEGKSTKDEMSRIGKRNRTISEHGEEKSTMQGRSIVWPENPLAPKPKEKKEGKIIDWLREQR